MTYWNKICGIGFFLFFFAINSEAQMRPVLAFTPPKFSAAGESKYKPNKNSLTNPHSFIKLLPGNYYTAHLGFFCKKELAVEKYLKVPFKFRLGSVAQSDYLEGKYLPLRPPR